MRFRNSRASGMMMDLWPALWASGGVRGHGAEGFKGGTRGTAAGLGPEFGESRQAH